MGYKHLFISDAPLELPNGKVVCVGKNYILEKAGHKISKPELPVLFMKPPSALSTLASPIELPTHGICYYEVEIAGIVNQPLKAASIEDAQKGVAGIALALDLTLKELLTELKSAGHPWELAKSFHHSCPISKWIPMAEINDINDITFSLVVNEALCQVANTKQMIFKFYELIAIISNYFPLFPGDVVLTGTPDGSAPLNSKDELKLKLGDTYEFITKVS